MMNRRAICWSCSPGGRARGAGRAPPARDARSRPCTSASAAGSACTCSIRRAASASPIDDDGALRDGVDLQAAAGRGAAVAGGSRRVSAHAHAAHRARHCCPTRRWSKQQLADGADGHDGARAVHAPWSCAATMRPPTCCSAGIGGPAAFTQFMRSIGDESHAPRSHGTGSQQQSAGRCARHHHAARHGGVDAEDLHAGRPVAGSRALLIDWMNASRTGLDRVRAGPAKAGGWRQDRHRAEWRDKRPVIAYPPDRRPIIIAVYMSESKLDSRN